MQLSIVKDVLIALVYIFLNYCFMNLRRTVLGGNFHFQKVCLSLSFKTASKKGLNLLYPFEEPSFSV